MSYKEDIPLYYEDVIIGVISQHADEDSIGLEPWDTFWFNITGLHFRESGLNPQQVVEKLSFYIVLINIYAF